MTTNGWEPVVGLEIHVHLKTRTKMFCRCELAYGAPENSRTCPVCLAHPGTLPVPNRAAIEATIKLGLALGCRIAPRALFHRKHYFYPDLPKGYQISQYDVPLCSDGRFAVPAPGGDREIEIVRAHLEEDAAKTVHVGGESGRIGGAAHSNVDFNRGGTPLVEIVTRPDLHSPEDARAFLQLLRQTIVELGISDAEMEKGTLRADANISVRRAGERALRTRTELKNMNSFSFIARGIEAEVARQVAVWESGGEVTQQTFDYDAATGKLRPHRTKEEAEDYRYLPEPDLVPVEPPAELVERLRAEVPELPSSRVRLLMDAHGRSYESALFIGRLPFADLFREMIKAGWHADDAEHALMNTFSAIDVRPELENLAELYRVYAVRHELPRPVVIEATSASSRAGFSAEPYLAQRAVADLSELDPVIDRILAANEPQVAQYRAGKEGLLGFFVGQVMRETQGKASPQVVNERLREKLKS